MENISFDDMISATEMAKPFKIKPAFWLRTDDAKNIISQICCKYNCKSEDA